MILTLASNYDGVYRDLIVHFGVAPLWFIAGIVIASQVSGKKWNRAFTWAAVWALAFPFVRLFAIYVEGVRGFLGSNNAAVPLSGVLSGSLYVSLAYLAAVASWWLLSRKKWSRGFTLAAAWALAFPVMPLLSLSIDGGRSVIGGNTVATVAAAALVWRATRSWIPVLGCAAGLLAAEAGFDCFLSPLADRADGMWMASLVWNACVFASLMVWAWRSRSQERKEGVCERCGYDLRGTLGRPCPECGDGTDRKEGGEWS